MKILIATILAALPLVVVGSTGHAARTDAGRWGIKPSPRGWVVQPDPKAYSKPARPDPRGYIARPPAHMFGRNPMHSRIGQR
jgi:hypothetical protein